MMRRDECAATMMHRCADGRGDATLMFIRLVTYIVYCVSPLTLSVPFAAHPTAGDGGCDCQERSLSSWTCVTQPTRRQTATNRSDKVSCLDQQIVLRSYKSLPLPHSVNCRLSHTYPPPHHHSSTPTHTQGLWIQSCCVWQAEPTWVRFFEHSDRMQTRTPLIGTVAHRSTLRPERELKTLWSCY